MASESSFTGFGDSLVDSVSADWCADLYPSCFDSDFFAFDVFEDGTPPQGAADSSSSSQPSPSPTSQFLHNFFTESPLDMPSFQGALRNTSLQAPREAPAIQPGTIVAPPHNTPPITPHNEAYKGERRFTGLAPSSSGVFPIPSPPATSSYPITTPPPDWIRIPQRIYDHGRKQLNFNPLEPISFSMNGRPGINMGDALRKAFTGLDGRDEPVLPDAAGAISCRLLFPGYPANSNSCQIHVLGWTKKRLPITRSKLAYEVAKKLERYLNHIANFTLDGSVEGYWRVGHGFMHIDNMFLVRLMSVSKGSFQPEIWVTGSSTPHVGTS